MAILQDDKINIWKISQVETMGVLIMKRRMVFLIQCTITVHRETGRGQGHEF